MISLATSLMLASFSPKREALYRVHCEPLWTREGISPIVQHDTDRSGCWTTCHRAWRRLLTETHSESHLCVLQDDFIPCRGFYERLLSVLREHPDDAVTFFQPAISPSDTREWCLSHRGVCDLPSNGATVWGGCLVLPRALAERVVDLADQIQIGQIDDVRLTMAMQIMIALGSPFKMKCIQPGLVKHLGARWESFQQINGCDSDEYTRFREGYFFADDY